MIHKKISLDSIFSKKILKCKQVPSDKIINYSLSKGFSNFCEIYQPDGSIKEMSSLMAYS